MFGMRSVMFGVLEKRHTGRMVYCLRELRASADARVPFPQGEGTLAAGSEEGVILYVFGNALESYLKRQ